MMGRAEFLVYTSSGPEWRPFDLVSIYPAGDGYCYRVPGEPEGWLPESAVRGAQVTVGEEDPALVLVHDGVLVLGA